VVIKTSGQMDAILSFIPTKMNNDDNDDDDDNHDDEKINSKKSNEKEKTHLD